MIVVRDLPPLPPHEWSTIVRVRLPAPGAERTPQAALTALALVVAVLAAILALT